MKKAVLVLVVASLALPTALRSGVPETDADLAKGKELVRQGEYEAAVRVLERVVARVASRRRDPMAAEAHLDLGVALAGLGRREAARAELVEALGLQPAITLDPSGAPPAAVDLFSEVWRERADEGKVATPTPPPPATSKRKMGTGAKIGVAAGVVALGVGAALTHGSGSEPIGPRLAFVPSAPSPYLRLVAATPDAGTTFSIGQPVMLTITSSIPASQGALSFHLVAEAFTSSGEPCLLGRAGPFGLSGGGGSISGTFSLSARCAAPFTTTSLILAMEDVATNSRPYSATYQGTYRVVP